MDLGLSWIEWLWFPQGAHLILLTVILVYATPGPGDSVPLLGLHGSSDSGLHPGIIGTWILYSTPGPHFDHDLWSHSGPQTKLVTLVPPLGLTLTWLFWSPFGLHLGLVNLVLSWSHLDLVNGLHLGLTWIGESC